MSDKADKKEAKSTFQKFSEITPDMVENWKKDRKKVQVFAYLVDDTNVNGPQAKFYVCQPTRPVVSAITQYASDKDFDKANDTTFNSCVLGGDMKYVKESSPDFEEDIYYSLLGDVGSLVGKKKKISTNS
jgi:hypothetical protein